MKILHGAVFLSPHLSRFLGSTGVSSDLIGVGLVIETAVTAVNTAAQRWPESRLIEWGEALSSLRKALRSASSTSETAHFFARPNPEPDIFRSVANWSSIQSDATFFQRLNSVLGRAWVIHGQRDQFIPETLARGLRTLQNTYLGKGKRSPDWGMLVNVDLTDLNGIRQFSQSTGPNSTTQNFLRCLDIVLSNDVLPYSDAPFATEKFGPEDPEQLNVSGSFIQKASQTTETNSPELQNGDSRTLDTRRVAARLSAADYSPALAKLGIDHRDHLLLDDLTAITSQLSRLLAIGSPLDQGYAAFHLICLLLSTSDLYARSIQLTEHSDHIWLDIERGVWCWDFAPYKYSGKERPKEAIGAEAVAVPLPLQFANYLQTLWKKDLQTDVESLICGIQGVDTFNLEDARQFLRRLGNPSHPPYRARWSNSLAPAMLQVTGSDMFTARTSAQFASVAPSALFYYAPTWQSIYDRLDQLFERLQLGPACRTFDANSRAGSTNIPSFEAIKRGWNELVVTCSSIEDQIGHVLSTAETMCLFNELMAHLAAAFVVQSAHRCQRFDKLTYGALTCSQDMLIIEDKVILDEAARSHPRLIGKTTQLDAIIRLAVRCRQLAAGKLDLPSVDVNTPVFVNVGDSPDSPQSPVASKWVAHIIAKFFSEAPDNFARSLWITTLDTCKVNRWLIRTLSGHVRDVSRMTGPFFDVPPAHAARQLKQAMEEVGAEIFSEVALDSPQLELPLLLPPPTATYSISPLHAKVSPQLILEPIDLGALSSASIAIRIREVLRSHAVAELSTHTNLLLHLMFVDLLDGEQIVLPAIRKPETHFTHAPPRPGVRWKRPYFVHDFWLPLTTESALLCVKLRSQAFNINLLDPELRQFIFRATSINLEADVFSLLLQWARAYKRIFFPPALLASATAHVESPCLNQASLTRLWQGNSIGIKSSLPALEIRGKHTTLSNDVEKLAGIINKFADTNERLGERRKRAVDALAAIHARGADWSPSGLFLKDWSIDELIRSRDNVHGRYEVSSFSTYLSRLKIGFQSIGDDPYDWGEQAWMDFVETVEKHFSDKDFKYGDVLTDGSRNALGALLRSLHRRAISVPRNLWTYVSDTEGITAPHDSASSTLLTEEDLLASDLMIGRTLGDYPPNVLRCRFRLRCGQIIPMRAGDFANFKRSFTTPAGGLIIERSGFNNIKNQQSVRIWQLGLQEVEALHNVASTLSAYVTNGDLLLRGTGRGSDNEEDLAASSTLNQTLKLATGDPKARMHSLRATTLQNLAWPQWQSLTARFLKFEVNAREINAWTTDRWNTWLSTARAAGAAGHSGIASALHNYLAGWPLVHVLHASALSSELTVSSAYIESLGLSITALRQARSRVNRKAPLSFVLQDWLQQQLRAQLHSNGAFNGRVFKVVEHTAPPSKPYLKPEQALRQETSSLQYLVSRALGEPQAAVQNRLLMGASVCQNLERRVLPEDLIAECSQRARAGAEPRAIAAHQKLLNSPEGKDLIDWIQTLSQQKFDIALYSFVWFLPLPAGYRPWTLNQWQTIADSLPTHIAIRLHRGEAHLTDEEVRFVAQQNLLVKPERDLGSRLRANLFVRTEPNNRVKTARLSTVFRILLLSMYSLNQG